MFVVHELEKILSSVLSDGSRGRNGPTIKTTLPALERVRVDQLRVYDRVRQPQIELKTELNEYQTQPIDLKGYISGRCYMTTDILFAANIKTLILDRLATLPERPYPAARFMICDRESYQSLLKFQYFTQKLDHEDSRDVHHKFLLHKRPFGLSAVVLLSDMLEVFDQVNRPIAKITSNGTASLDYTIIKQIFPYLKITDLVVVLNKIGNLRLHTFTVDASRAHQIIQFLAHFARSSCLIELQTICARLGQQHPLHDNVAILQPLEFANPSLWQTAEPVKTNIAISSHKTNGKHLANPHLSLTLHQLSDLAHRLHQLLSQLEWQLESITYRASDSEGFSKIFSQILEKISRSPATNKPKPPPAVSESKHLSIVPVRVLVLDRFFDLHGLLRHSDRYGPFLEQENSSGPCAGLRLDQVDALDRVLYGERLSEVLKTILSYTTNPDLVPSRTTRAQTVVGSNHVTTKANSVSSSALRRHLDSVKIIYNSLNDGYLLLLKLESSLLSVVDRLRMLDEPLGVKEVLDIIERLRRNATILKQLSGIESHSISPVNTLRIALIWIDLVNRVHHLRRGQEIDAYRSLLNAKSDLIACKEFMNAKIDFASRPPNNGKLAEAPRGRDTASPSAREVVSLSTCMEKFDKISRAHCSNRSGATLEELVEAFYTRKLRAEGYSTLKLPPSGNGLVKNVSRNKIVVLVLGSMSYDELARIKLLESQLMSRRRFTQPVQPKARLTSSRQSAINTKVPLSGDILAIASGLIRPEEFVASLWSI